MSATMSKHGLEACELVSLEVRGDHRGSLIALEGRSAHVPFDIARAYYIYGTVAGTERGFHAHYALRQLAIAVSGSCMIRLDDGSETRDMHLHRPDRGLIIGPMVWREMRDFSYDCVLLVLADAPYDEADYIRDYATFTKLTSR